MLALIKWFSLFALFFSSLSSGMTMDELKSLAGKIKSHEYLSLDFTQQAYRAIRDRTSTIKGVAQFKAPAKFRWNIVHPLKDEWRYNGASLFHVVPEQNILAECGPEDGKGKELREIIQIVTDFNMLIQKYDISKAEKKKNLVYLTLKPRSPVGIDYLTVEYHTEKRHVTNLGIYFDKERSTAKQNYSIFNFTNPRSESIPEALFTKPKGKKAGPCV